MFWGCFRFYRMRRVILYEWGCRLAILNRFQISEQLKFVLFTENLQSIFIDHLHITSFYVSDLSN